MKTHKINLSGHQNDDLDRLGFTFPGPLHADLQSPDLAANLTDFLATRLGIASGDTVTLCVPGHGVLSALVITIIHGLTGQFPKIISLTRDAASGTFVAGQTHDLGALRNGVARSARRDAILL